MTLFLLVEEISVEKSPGCAHVLIFLKIPEAINGDIGDIDKNISKQGKHKRNKERKKNKDKKDKKDKKGKDNNSKKKKRNKNKQKNKHKNKVQ